MSRWDRQAAVGESLSCCCYLPAPPALFSNQAQTSSETSTGGAASSGSARDSLQPLLPSSCLPPSSLSCWGHPPPMRTGEGGLRPNRRQCKFLMQPSLLPFPLACSLGQTPLSPDPALLKPHTFLPCQKPHSEYPLLES